MNLPMCSDLAISVKHLTKNYRIFGHPTDRIKQALTLGRMRFHREFIALQDVSFDIRKGETVGIIGRNGSGKSTLLQLICGILKPSSGQVQVNGRVSALLELGSGFNPDFTGRENVYFQGAIIGISMEEMDARFADIIAFADIGEFIDQPVRTYSSGMFVRLAFAVAVAIEPDILVVDEALSVGDAKFQAKCFRKFEVLKNAGKTILFVSHSTEQITRFCDTAFLLEGGRLAAAGETGVVINQYLTLLFKDTDAKTASQGDIAGNAATFALPDKQERYHLRPAYNPDEYRWGNRTASILDFMLHSGKCEHTACIGLGEDVVLDLKVAFFHNIEYPIYGVTIKSKDGITLFGTNSRDYAPQARECFQPQQAGHVVMARFTLRPHLSAGDYFISVGVVDGAGENLVPLDRRYDSIHFTVTGPAVSVGMVDMAADFEITTPGYA
jgi:lipopolysaccharide transport system ATP-binding protein